MKIVKTAPNGIKVLWMKNFLFESKDFKEIKNKLSEFGYNFSDKNLLMTLRRAKFLTRKGKRGRYCYIQKYPYIENGERNGKKN